MAKAKGESKMRKTGILMPVSSLPSRTGVGEMGAEAYHFLTLLKESGVLWNIIFRDTVRAVIR